MDFTLLIVLAVIIAISAFIAGRNSMKTEMNTTIKDMQDKHDETVNELRDAKDLNRHFYGMKR